MPRYVVPGRVELVGKHVDYAGGRSLTCAVDLAISATTATLREPVLQIHDRTQKVLIPLDPDAAHVKGTPSWSTYALAVARRFSRDFPDARRGVEIQLSSTLPPSAGLSSSSALIVVLALALTDANEMQDDERWRELVPDDLARAEYFSAMETGAPYRTLVGDAGVGVRGGAQDPIAIMCARENMLGQFSYLPARLERRVPWPEGYRIAIGVSGVLATKTGNARELYNRASDATRALVDAHNRSRGTNLETLREALVASPHEVAAAAHAGAGGFSANVLAPRLAQFREEVEEIVPGVAEAFASADIPSIGRLMDRSQMLAESALGNQVPETVHLARSAREIGAAASSAFGAGFGGAVWAMIPADVSQLFLARWRKDYARHFPEAARRAKWLLTRPGGPARRVD
jgi:galactokinase